MPLSTFSGTGADLKLKSFGPDGFAEIVFNSFGAVRIFHNDSDGGSGNVVSTGTAGGRISFSDGDTIRFKQTYSSAADTMTVSYSLNGGSEVSLYSRGSGIDGSFGNILTTRLEAEVFEFGVGAPSPLVKITSWKLLSGTAPPGAPKGTVILLSGVSGWLALILGFTLWREVWRCGKKDGK